MLRKKNLKLISDSAFYPFSNSSFFAVELLFKCHFVAWSRGLPRKFADLENGSFADKLHSRKSNKTRTREEKEKWIKQQPWDSRQGSVRGKRKVESNNSPEIPNKGVLADVPASLRGNQNWPAFENGDGEFVASLRAGLMQKLGAGGEEGVQNLTLDHPLILHHRLRHTWDCCGMTKSESPCNACLVQNSHVASQHLKALVMLV